MLTNTRARARIGTITHTGLIALIALLPFSTSVHAQTIDLQLRHRFQIPAEALEAALRAFSAQSHIHLVASGARTRVLSPGVSGELSSQNALAALLSGTGMTFRQVDGETLVIAPAQTAQLRPTQFQLIGDVDPTALADQPTAAAAPGAAGGQVSLSEITVTGTRIIRNGYEAPTPVTVVGAQLQLDQAAVNYADVLNEMPMFQGSSTPTNTGVDSGGFQSGVNELNLRDLGTNRVLVMFDSRRFPATSTNVVNVNMFPDALVQRVDVVTGGASSVYGSDAVAGVVNYVLNTDFNGIQGLVQGGITGQGDGQNDKLQLTVGTAFADGRGHIELSADQQYQAEFFTAARSWTQTGEFLIPNPAYKAGSHVPQMITDYDVGPAYGARGGIISGGPLQGTAFGAGGTPYQWDFGSLLDGTYQVGGSWAQSTMAPDESIETGQNATHFFTDVRFDITDNLQIYAQFNDGFSHTDDQCCFTYYEGSNLTLYTSNPYLPASTATQAAAATVSSFPYGIIVPDSNIPNGAIQGGFGNITSDWDDVYVLGLKGKFNALESDWNWNVYGQMGLVTSQVWVPYQTNTVNFMDAIQDVRVGSYGGNTSTTSISAAGTATTTAAYTAANFPNPLGIATGTITCASNLLPLGAAAETKNCVPYDVFGTGVAIPAAVNYVMGGPFERYTIGQYIAGGSITGEPFSTWAGPVSVAADAEYRTDSIQGYSDPVSAVRGWFSSELNAYDASQYVYEGALETVVPLLKDAPWAKELDVNGAVRATEYSTSGYVTTYKYGIEYTPITDVRLRAYRSEDIRAPTVNDLFAAPSTNHNTIADPFFNNVSYPYYQVTDSNPKLKPEKAHTTGFGVVFQPVELPGFGASVDFYDLKLDDAIETLSFSYELLECYAGVQAYCGDISRLSNGFLNAITVQPINLESYSLKGLDYEADYQKRLGDLVSSWTGTVSLRLQATETLDLITNTGIGGPTEILNGAGVGSVPRWGVFGTLSYELDPWRFAWTSRYDSAVERSDVVIACSTNCPTTVPAGFTTEDENRVPSYIVSNLSINYKFLEHDARTAEAFLTVNNVFNKIPPGTPGSGASYGLYTNGTLYDMIGLDFRVGIRFKL